MLAYPDSQQLAISHPLAERFVPLCNDFGNRIPYSDYVEAFSQTRLPLKVPAAIPNLEPRDDIWPTDTAPVLRLAEGVVELVQLGGPVAAEPKLHFRCKDGLASIGSRLC